MESLLQRTCAVRTWCSSWCRSGASPTLTLRDHPGGIGYLSYRLCRGLWGILPLISSRYLFIGCIRDSMSTGRSCPLVESLLHSLNALSTSANPKAWGRRRLYHTTRQPFQAFTPPTVEITKSNFSDPRIGKTNDVLSHGSASCRRPPASPPSSPDPLLSCISAFHPFSGARVSRPSHKCIASPDPTQPLRYWTHVCSRAETPHP